MDRWIDRSLDRWIDGSIDRWINRSLVRWSHSSVDRWIARSMDPVSSLCFQCPFNSRPWYESNSKLINYITSFYVNVIVLPLRADFELFEAPFTNAIEVLVLLGVVLSRFSKFNMSSFAEIQSVADLESKLSDIKIPWD